MSDLSTAVRRRAAGLCEYCRIPQAGFRRPFHIEHVIARHLALACWACNLKKGPNLTGIDPQSKRITPLFDPRKDRWADHFVFSVGSAIPAGIEIRGLSDVGRTTVMVLAMNTDVRQMVRYELWREGVKF